MTRPIPVEYQPLYKYLNAVRSPLFAKFPYASESGPRGAYRNARRFLANGLEGDCLGGEGGHAANAPALVLASLKNALGKVGISANEDPEIIR